MTVHTPAPMRRPSRLVPLAAALLVAATLSGCAAVVVGSAVGGALVATDRRTPGTQLEDQGIELKASSAVSQLAGDRAHINVTSYNRVVLITGEVADDALRTQIEQTVASVANVRSVVNESAVMGLASLTSRSNDAILTSRVKASFVDASDVQATAVKVVTERGVVHLMGRLTEREGNRAAEVARNVSGVQRVVKVFETMSEEELARLQPKAPPPPAPAPVVNRGS